MKELLTDTPDRKIFAVNFGKDGERIEYNFDLLSAEEKRQLGEEINRKALQMTGFSPVSLERF